MQNFGPYVVFVFVSANVQAKAVERMQHKCEQKMATVVIEATRSLSHELKKVRPARLGPSEPTKQSRGQSSLPPLFVS